MSSEPLEAFVAPVAPLVPKVEIDQALGIEQPLPTPEQARLANEALAQDNSESDTVAGVLGLWTGGLILSDLLRDSLASSLEKEEEAKKKRKKTPPQ
jgi:hypothetical protein